MAACSANQRESNVAIRWVWLDAKGDDATRPEVPADVMVWLATSPEADALQKRTLNAQSLARERGLGQAAA